MVKEDSVSWPQQGHKIIYHEVSYFIRRTCFSLTSWCKYCQVPMTSWIVTAHDPEFSPIEISGHVAKKSDSINLLIKPEEEESNGEEKLPWVDL